MTQVAQAHGRSRSDSFQCMLDLEKKMMLHRKESAAGNSDQSTPTGSVPPSPLPQPRRFELVPKEGKKVPPPPVRNYGSMQPQLFTSSTEPIAAGSDPEAAIQRKPVVHARSVSMSITMMEKAPAQKSVAFAFPPQVHERRSVSQSPPIKHEKKDDKRDDKRDDKKKQEEKKGKEQAVKETKPRGRRLSKAPPTYLTPSTQGRTATEPVKEMSHSTSLLGVSARTATEPVKEKSRSSSLLGIPIHRKDTAKEDSAEKPKRGRSGSLTSVIRGSFEIRRGSWDQTSASGFLGGVKLEKKKQDFTQQVLEDQAQGSSTVHPALRKSFLGHGSFTPLKTSPQPEKDAEAQHRAYPPISINNSGGMNPANASPKTPRTPRTPSRRGSAGSANIYLWSARAKKKLFDQRDECAVGDDEGEAEPEVKNDSPVDPPSLPKDTIGLTRRGGVHIKNISSHGAISGALISKFSTEGEGKTTTSDVEAVKPLNITKKEIVPKIETMAPEPEPEPVKDTTTEHKGLAAHPPASPKTRQRRESNTPSLSSPPAPPRKSSKRHPTPPLSRVQTAPVDASKDDSNRTSKESTRSDKSPLAAIKTSSAKRHAAPPSIRYETTLAGVRPTPYPAGSPTSPTTNWSPAKPHGSTSNLSESTSSPTSTARSFSPSPLKTEMVALSAIDTQSMAKKTDIKPTFSNIKTPRPSAEKLAPMKVPPPTTQRPTTSSSDESLYSDALQTTSGPDTPDTSPPQSDSGYRLNGEKRLTQYSPYWTMQNSPEMSGDRFQVSDVPNSEEEVDPIEAAARRVMEAFSNANLRSPATSGKEDSSADSSLPSTPILETQPRLRHKAKSKGRLRPASIQTVKLSQTTNGPKAVKSTPNLDVRGHKSGHPAPEGSKQSQDKPNPQRGDRVGKMFVVCCECRRYHDIPSKLYKTMLNPGGILDQPETKGFEDRVCMTVKCSWCDHQMSTKCCPGVSSVLDVQQRIH